MIPTSKLHLAYLSKENGVIFSNHYSFFPVTQTDIFQNPNMMTPTIFLTLTDICNDKQRFLCLCFVVYFFLFLFLLIFFLFFLFVFVFYFFIFFLLIFFCVFHILILLFYSFPFLPLSLLLFSSSSHPSSLLFLLPFLQ